MARSKREQRQGRGKGGFWTFDLDGRKAGEAGSKDRDKDKAKEDKAGDAAANRGSASKCILLSISRFDSSQFIINAQLGGII